MRKCIIVELVNWIIEFDEETNIIEFREMLCKTLDEVEDTINRIESRNIIFTDMKTLQIYAMQDFTKFNWEVKKWKKQLKIL